MIDILLAYYNRPSELMRAISSVQRQSYENWRLLVLDDESDTDMSASVGLLHDERIVYYRIPHQGTLAKVRNYSSRWINAEWVAFLDDDDWWHTDKLRVQMDWLSRNPTVGILASEACEETVGMEGKLDDELASKLRVRWVDSKDLAWANCVYHPSVIMKRVFFEELGGYDIHLDNWEDWDLWIRYTDRYGSIPVIDASLLHYTINPNGVTRSGVSDVRKVWERINYMYNKMEQGSFLYKKTILSKMNYFCSITDKSTKRRFLKALESVTMTPNQPGPWAALLLFWMPFKWTWALRIFIQNLRFVDVGNASKRKR